MLFDFIGMQRLYLSLARADAAAAGRGAPGPAADRPRAAQWATFVRNHDELTLDKLSDDERQEVFAAFGPEPEMQVYGRGLRRRLPPMLDGDPRRIRMVYSLLFSLPGTPVLFYGEEIGMGENLAAEGRMRGPHADAVDRRPQRRLLRRARRHGSPRPIVQGGFGPEHVNVEPSAAIPTRCWSFVTLARAALPRGARARAGASSRCSTSRSAPCSRTR